MPKDLRQPLTHIESTLIKTGAWGPVIVNQKSDKGFLSRATTCPERSRGIGSEGSLSHSDKEITSHETLDSVRHRPDFFFDFHGVHHDDSGRSRGRGANSGTACGGPKSRWVYIKTCLCIRVWEVRSDVLE